MLPTPRLAAVLTLALACAAPTLAEMGGPHIPSETIGGEFSARTDGAWAAALPQLAATPQLAAAPEVGALLQSLASLPEEDRALAVAPLALALERHRYSPVRLEEALRDPDQARQILAEAARDADKDATRWVQGMLNLNTEPRVLERSDFGILGIELGRESLLEAQKYFGAYLSQDTREKIAARVDKLHSMIIAKGGDTALAAAKADVAAAKAAAKEARDTAMPASGSFVEERFGLRDTSQDAAMIRSIQPLFKLGLIPEEYANLAPAQQRLGLLPLRRAFYNSKPEDHRSLDLLIEKDPVATRRQMIHYRWEANKMVDDYAKDIVRRSLDPDLSQKAIKRLLDEIAETRTVLGPWMGGDTTEDALINTDTQLRARLVALKRFTPREKTAAIPAVDRAAPALEIVPGRKGGGATWALAAALAGAGGLGGAFLLRQLFVRS